MTWNVLITAPYFQPVIDQFEELFASHGIAVVVPEVNERMEEADLIPLLPDIDGVICGDDRFTERALKSAPRLKVLSKWGTGIDSIDQEACRRMGIRICYTPNALSEAVADSVLGYMLCFCRRLPWMDRAMRSGRWDKIPGRTLRECTVGVVGVGNVGKTVIRRASGFGAKLLGNDPVEMPEAFLAETGVNMVPLDDLLEQADFISINCDLNPTSYHLMDEHAFHRARPQAVLINAARGPVVHERALIEALQEGRIAGAALDVFEEEPLPEGSPLRDMPNVMLAPHNANSSPEAWERVHKSTVDQLIRELERRAG